MIYLDNGATSFRKPPGVYRAVERAMYTCANPGRGGYSAAMEASETVYACREAAAELFHNLRFARMHGFKIGLCAGYVNAHFTGFADFAVQIGTVH